VGSQTRKPARKDTVPVTSPCVITLACLCAAALLHQDVHAGIPGKSLSFDWHKSFHVKCVLAVRTVTQVRLPVCEYASLPSVIACFQKNLSLNRMCLAVSAQCWKASAHARDRAGPERGCRHQCECVLHSSPDEPQQASTNLTSWRLCIISPNPSNTCDIKLLILAVFCPRYFACKGELHHCCLAWQIARPHLSFIVQSITTKLHFLGS